MRYIKIFFFIIILAQSPLTLAAHEMESSQSRGEMRIYHIDKKLDLVSMQKIRYERRIVVKSIFPQLKFNEETEDDAKASDGKKSIEIEQFNQMMLRYVDEASDQFVKESQAQARLDQEPLRNNLYIDYNSSILRAGTHRIVSVRFALQASGPLAPRFHYHQSFNFDLTTNQPLALSSLFLEDRDYFALLSTYTRRVLEKRFTTGTLYEEGIRPLEANFSVWNIKPQGLLITFDAGQVTPQVHGTQTVMVPYDVLREVVSSDSPLVKCIKSKRHCAQSNLLTGGFIDEAINADHRRFNPVFGLR